MIESFWSKFDASPKVPASVTKVAATIDTLASLLTTALGVVQTSVEVLARLEVGRLSAAQLLVDSALKTLESGLESLLGDGGMYILFVPAQKRVTYHDSVAEAFRVAGIEGVEDTGGNAGFVRTVLESLDDAGDINRPQLGAEMHVVGCYMVAGSDDFRSLLSFISTIGALFGGDSSRVETDSAVFPVPQNLRAQSNEGGTLLQWDYHTSRVRIPEYDLKGEITELAVLRSTDPSFLRVRAVGDLFDSTRLSVGASVGATEVVDIISYTEFTVEKRPAYWDKTPPDSKTPYYYAVAYRLRDTGAGTDWGYGKLSNAVKVRTPTASAAGVPPDWQKFSLRDSTPVGKFAAQAQHWVRQASAVPSGRAVMMQGYLELLSAKTAQYEAMASRVTSAVSQISRLAAAPNISAAVRFFDGKGGTAFVRDDVTKAFAAENTDPERPAFDAGTEFVTGMVFLASAPTSVALEPARAILDMLFGTSEQQSAITAAIDQIRSLQGEALAEFRDTPFPSDLESKQHPLIGEDDDGVNC